MATQNDFSRSFGVNAALSGFRRVMVSNNGSVGYADNLTLGVGVLQQDVTNNSYYTPAVRFYSTGTYMCAVTAVPVTIGDTVYAAVTGYVSSTGTVVAGHTLTSAASAGDWIEIVPPNGTVG